MSNPPGRRSSRACAWRRASASSRPTLELLATRGFLELSLADAAAAESTLDAVAERAAATGFLEPALFRYHGDRIEAKIALGHREEAEQLVSDLEQLGARLRRAWPLAIAARCRGMLCSALGEPEAAFACTRRRHSRCTNASASRSSARARCSCWERVQRRERQKRPARESLEAALEIFQTLGAALWAERARGELARVGGRASTPGLTATEERVAELLASGLTYQQAADALFVSPKTVQWNVSKIYRKLGIHSRAELIKHFEDSGLDRRVPSRDPAGQCQPVRPDFATGGGPYRRSMNTHPVAPQALRGYPVDHDLIRANRAQRGPRRRFRILRTLTLRLPASAVEAALGRRRQHLDDLVQRQAAARVEHVEAVEAREQPEHVGGVLLADVRAQQACRGEPLRQPGHAAGPGGLEPLNRSAHGVRVELRHRVEHAEDVAVRREHARAAREAVAQALARVRGWRLPPRRARTRR